MRIAVRGHFAGEPAVSTGITYDVELEGDAPEHELQALIARVDRIGEVPNSLRRGTPVRLGAVSIAS